MNNHKDNVFKIICFFYLFVTSHLNTQNVKLRVKEHNIRQVYGSKIVYKKNYKYAKRIRK